jgi:hypothetical protein
MSVKVHVSYTGPRLNNQSLAKELKVKSFLVKKGSYIVDINEVANKITVVASRIKNPLKTYTLTIEKGKVSKEIHKLNSRVVFDIEAVLESIKWGRDLGLSKIGKKVSSAVWKC